nr:AraC family transcriptional regulator [Bradyrhizobium sp. CW7]
MTDLIRSAGLSYYPEVARSVGLDPKHMMRKVRLPLACLDKPDTPIAVTGLRRLLELSAEASGAEDFGLRLAERGGLTNFGAVGLIVREQATVGEAIEAFSRFIPIHHDGMKLDVTRNKQTVTVTQHLRGRQPTAPRQSIDMALGSVHRIIQSLFGSDWRPQEVHLHYPPPLDRKRYREFYGCRVTFNAEAIRSCCRHTTWSAGSRARIR